MNKLETWKPIVCFDSYAVSDAGNVKNIKTGKVLTPYPNSTNRTKAYLQVSLMRSGFRYTFLVHRLVMQAFKHLECKDGLVVNHINENRFDNRLENLEMITQSQNLTYRGAQRRKKENVAYKTLVTPVGGTPFLVDSLNDAHYITGVTLSTIKHAVDSNAMLLKKDAPFNWYRDAEKWINWDIVVPNKMGVKYLFNSIKMVIDKDGNTWVKPYRKGQKKVQVIGENVCFPPEMIARFEKTTGRKFDINNM